MSRPWNMDMLDVNESKVQHFCPAWVGRKRYKLGIRCSHPWRDWPLDAIRRLDPDYHDCLPAVQKKLGPVIVFGDHPQIKMRHPGFRRRRKPGNLKRRLRGSRGIEQSRRMSLSELQKL